METDSQQHYAPVAQDLNPEPKGNGGALLAYWKGGLFNRFGRVWACWGDLRTERIKSDELHANRRAHMTS